ncbi:MAG: SulP family inorganic anion transporter [Vulcanimicrobiota bacterium]
MRKLNLRFQRDFPGALTVFLVALPLCLGLAHACHLPPVSGLVAGVVGGVVVGFLSGSQLSITGPASGLVPVVLFGLERLGSPPAFFTAVALAGLMQMLLGLARAGAVSRFFPAAVVRGMMAAIGLMMIYKQIPHLLGFDAENFSVEGGSILQSPLSASPLDAFPLVLGLLSLLLMSWWELRMHPRRTRLPGAIVVCGLGIVLSKLVEAIRPGLALRPEHRVQIPHDWFLVHPGPDWSALAQPQLYWVALSLALIASVEALVALEAIDRLDPQHRVAPPNREMWAQGLGNLLSGLLGGMPVTSVVARGSVNVSAGARSKAAAIGQGLLLGLTLLLFRPQLNELPLSCLAAVLIVVGAFLIQGREVREIFRQGPTQWLPFLATVVGILAGDLMIGVFLGCLTSFVFVLGGLFGSTGFSSERHGRTVEIKLASEVTFFHRSALLKVLQQLRSGDQVHIDGSDTRRVSYDVLEAIQEFRKGAPFRGIRVVVGGLAGIPSHSKEHIQQLDEEYRLLIENNKEWVAERLSEDPQYFEHMSVGQAPTFLFIGCSDSRVPAESITKTDPGKLFVHRNIANIVSHSDVNLMSVLQYSVEVLRVPHIIVCGHYGCGGVRAALGNTSLGLIDQWIIPIKTTFELNKTELMAISDLRLRERRAIELHVIAQVHNLLKTSILQRSLKHYGRPRVHGWVYDLETGLINDLAVELNPRADLHPIFQFDFSSGEGESH